MIDIQEFVALYPVTAYVLLGVFSLLVGSFLNVVIYRLPLMINAELRIQSLETLNLSTENESNCINLCTPRSHCNGCKKPISVWHNIPILSYIFLRGKCAFCKSKISLMYPVIEIICVVLSLSVGYYFGFGLALLFILPFVWTLICLSVIDFNYQILPDCLTLGLLWLGLLANTQEIFTSLSSAIIGVVVAYLGLWIFIKIFYLITGKIGMGNGDFKLLAALSAWFGWNAIVFILLISSVLGTSIGLIYLISSGKSKDTLIPFGPFLCIAGFAYLFLKNSISWP
ncbi:MAG: A24 family peptidase [Legionellaceae bacterium]|nr:A24 family peptidase [Legionellaceae bacterium]